MERDAQIAIEYLKIFLIIHASDVLGAETLLPEFTPDVIQNMFLTWNKDVLLLIAGNSRQARVLKKFF